MDLDQLHIRARIELLATADGGRETVLRGPVSYRPNHNFFGESDRDMCMGAIELEECQALAPGGTMDLDLTLWTWPALSCEVRRGRRWRLQEGARLIGWGTVLEIFES